MNRSLRWTEHAVIQLAAIAEHISLSSPIYAEQVVLRVEARMRQVMEFPSRGVRSQRLGVQTSGS